MILLFGLLAHDFTPCQNINRKGVLQRFVLFIKWPNQEKAKRRDTWNEPEAATYFYILSDSSFDSEM